jgi:hypothetical protein
MGKIKERILRGIKDDGIVCPVPITWNKFFEIIVEKKDRAEWPPLPMVLTGWYLAGKDEKHQRFCEHIQWAEDNGVIEIALNFINKIKLDNWYYYSTNKNEFIRKRENDRRDFVSYFSKAFPVSNKKIKESKKYKIHESLSLWMSLCNSNLEVEHLELMKGKYHLKSTLERYFDHNPFPLSIREIYLVIEYYSLNRPNRLLPIDERCGSLRTYEDAKDSSILFEKVDHIISEFMDEYIIIGKKIGRNQKMLLSRIQKEGLISDMHSDCMNWAYSRGKYE